MKTKSLIIYGSPKKQNRACIQIHPDYFVRVKLVSLNSLDALGYAKPLPGEIVLNTVEITPNQKHEDQS